MIELDVFQWFYLIIRLSPLLVVSHFVLQSILNQDAKGIVYLTGLIFTCVFAIGVGKVLPFSKDDITQKDLVCSSMGFGDFPNVSVSQVVLGFTYGYLMYIIYNYSLDGSNYASSNMPTIVLFPILIATNGLWNLTNKCVNLPVLFASAVVGAGGGCGWGHFLKSSGYKELALFNGISNQAICNRPSKTKFVCKTTKR